MPAESKSRHPQRRRNATPSKIEEHIRRRAYPMYEQRGRVEGFAINDWLQAESEILGAQKKHKAKAAGERISMLSVIKLLHTAIWAFMVLCILALPVVGLKRRFNWAMILTAIILVECGVLALNRGRCPLTDAAARLTHERTCNFDIYLPNWLACRNKAIFGTLFAVNEVIVLWSWRKQAR